jgi:hypothetical protein
MELGRGQPVLPRTLPERSIVEALAGLLTLDLPMHYELRHPAKLQQPRQETMHIFPQTRRY